LESERQTEVLSDLDLKILFYNHTAQVSGAERVLGMILTRMNRDQFTPVVLCPPGPMMEMSHTLGVPCEGVAPLTARFTWRVDRIVRYVASFAQVIREVRNRVRKIQPDIIHANSIRAGLVMTFATAGLDVPVVWHAHDVLPHHPLSIAVRICAFISRRNSILAVSCAAGDRFRGILLRWFDQRIPIRVIHNAVDLESFQPNAERRHQIRTELGITERERVIGIVGHLSPRKGQLELIKAFAAISRERPDAVLLVIGESLFNRGANYAASLVRAASSFAVTDRVRFLGPRRDVPALLQALDLLVVNSRTEAFPLIVLEGLASGTPVLATAVGGTPEIIRHQENGWLVPAGDNHSLAEGILRLLGDSELRATLAECGRVDANALYSADRFIRNIQNFYRQILNVRAELTVPRAREIGERA
jgi:glycosyltransferase involved in cell wall biosynthesis